MKLPSIVSFRVLYHLPYTLMAALLVILQNTSDPYTRDINLNGECARYRVPCSSGLDSSVNEASSTPASPLLMPIPRVPLAAVDPHIRIAEYCQIGVSDVSRSNSSRCSSSSSSNSDGGGGGKDRADGDHCGEAFEPRGTPPDAPRPIAAAAAASPPYVSHPLPPDIFANGYTSNLPPAPAVHPATSGAPIPPHHRRRPSRNTSRPVSAISVDNHSPPSTPTPPPPPTSALPESPASSSTPTSPLLTLQSPSSPLQSPPLQSPSPPPSQPPQSPSPPLHIPSQPPQSQSPPLQPCSQPPNPTHTQPPLVPNDTSAHQTPALTSNGYLPSSALNQLEPSSRRPSTLGFVPANTHGYVMLNADADDAAARENYSPSATSASSPLFRPAADGDTGRQTTPSPSPPPPQTKIPATNDLHVSLRPVGWGYVAVNDASQ